MPFGSIGSCCCSGPPGKLCVGCSVTITSGTLTIQGIFPGTCGGGGFFTSFFTGVNDMVLMTTPNNAITPNAGGPSGYLFGSDWILYQSGCGSTDVAWIQFAISCSGGFISLLSATTVTSGPVPNARTITTNPFDVTISLQAASASASTCSPFAVSFGHPSSTLWTSAAFS